MKHNCVCGEEIVFQRTLPLDGESKVVAQCKRCGDLIVPQTTPLKAEKEFIRCYKIKQEKRQSRIKRGLKISEDWVWGKIENPPLPKSETPLSILCPKIESRFVDRIVQINLPIWHPRGFGIDEKLLDKNYIAVFCPYKTKAGVREFPYLLGATREKWMSGYRKPWRGVNLRVLNLDQLECVDADLGWANNWREDFPVVDECVRLKHARNDTDIGPQNRGLEHVVRCSICKYTYRYDSSD